jgi:hypothetical protein
MLMVVPLFVTSLDLFPEASEVKKKPHLGPNILINIILKHLQSVFLP